MDRHSFNVMETSVDNSANLVKKNQWDQFSGSPAPSQMSCRHLRGHCALSNVKNFLSGRWEVFYFSRRARKRKAVRATCAKACRHAELFSRNETAACIVPCCGLILQPMRGAAVRGAAMCGLKISAICGNSVALMGSGYRYHFNVRAVSAGCLNDVAIPAFFTAERKQQNLRTHSVF